ncbi:MAG: outer membrane protein [Phycisphaerales bacterium]|jgi:outer membrane protein
MNTSRNDLLRPCTPPSIPARLAAASALVTVCLVTASGCGPGPIEQRSEQALQRSLIDSLQRQIAQAEQNRAPQTATRGEDRSGDLQIRPEHLEQIQKDYSVEGYLRKLKAAAEAEDSADGTDPFDEIFGTNLYGQPQRAVGVSLERVIAKSLEHNLDVQIARFGPAISEAQLVAAEAEFDWTFSTGVTWDDNDTPQVGPGFLALDAVRSADQSVAWTAGLDRQLETGGSIGVSQALTYRDERASAFGTVGSPNPASNLAYTLDYTQPLLRGFGSDSALAQVRLNRNAERREISNLRSTLIGTLTGVENAYWELVTAYRELIIQHTLLQRGIQTRDDIIARRVQDARQAQVADAVARVERRRGDLMQAQTTLRRASDRLKALINDPAVPVGSEVQLLPVDSPLDQPVEFSLVDSLTTAAERRPELESALLDIDDTSIRQQLSRNARRPRLDLQAQLQMLDLQGNAGDAYDQNFEGEFIDSFLLGFTFEQPLGNRAGEAGYRQRRLERMRSVVEYRNTLQTIVLEVKESLDSLATNARLIEQARLSRIAQGEALRTLQVEKRLTDAGYTVERLNLELNRQESLASAERAETAALINYNRSMADLHAATGTTLERNRIDFVVPDANQLEPGQSPLEFEPGESPQN